MKKNFAIFLQKYFKELNAKKKVLKMLKVSRGAYKLLSIYNKKKMKKAVNALILNKTVILLQSFARRKKC